MNISVGSNREEHQSFLTKLSESEPIHGWSVQCLDCDAYLWHHPNHDKVKLFLTPFFEGYSRVLLTICTWGQKPHVADPINLTINSLTLDEFRGIAVRMIERAMNSGHLPDTRA